MAKTPSSSEDKKTMRTYGEVATRADRIAARSLMDRDKFLLRLLTWAESIPEPVMRELVTQEPRAWKDRLMQWLADDSVIESAQGTYLPLKSPLELTQLRTSYQLRVRALRDAYDSATIRLAQLDSEITSRVKKH
jgi:hypothetical protein